MSLTTKILQLTNSETVSRTLTGSAYESVTLTHLKLSSLKVEMARPDANKDPFIEIWFAKGYFTDSGATWNEPSSVAGLQVLINDPTWTTLLNGALDVDKFVEVEEVFYNFCLTNQLIPAGTLQDFVV